jgi:hypothetical protein
MHQLQLLRGVLQALADPLAAPCAARRANRNILRAVELSVSRKTAKSAALVCQSSMADLPARFAHLYQIEVSSWRLEISMMRSSVPNLMRHVEICTTARLPLPGHFSGTAIQRLEGG